MIHCARPRQLSNADVAWRFVVSSALVAAARVRDRKCAREPAAALALHATALLHKGVAEVLAIVVARLWFTDALGCAGITAAALPGRGCHSSTSWESCLLTCWC